MDKIPTVILNPAVRHEFVLLFDAKDSNPNGDPDSANSPRVDPETGQGLVTDVALKRKVRDFVVTTRGLNIFIQSDVALNTLKEQAADRLNPPVPEKERKGGKPIPALRSQMCDEYYDIRMFGAVLATGEPGDRLNAGQVRGPMQVTFARSIDPVTVVDHPLTRNARTTETRMETGPTEFGRKPVVLYGLYRAHGYFNPFLADKTGVTSTDLDAFWEALRSLFEFDRSAARPDMSVRGLYVFTHNSKLGNAHATKLFELIQVSKADGPVREFNPDRVRIDWTNVPDGVTPTTLVGVQRPTND